jgi:hypothetical protein
MRFSASALTFVTALSLPYYAIGQQGCQATDPLPLNADDFGEPDWAAIIEIAFPSWELPPDGCPRLDGVGGELVAGFDTFPTPEEGKFNPCYYTKAFAGLDPMNGGYPTPIDTQYPYEFAAPFFKQPGDGSTHHCPIDSPADIKIQTCPKAAPKCEGDKKDCNTITDELGIGHVPPFVPLAAIKNAYLGCEEDVCDWFPDQVKPCNIPKSVMDRLVYKYFGVDGEIQFTPPIILDDVPVSSLKSTYYKLEYINQGDACADGNCRGPHYCSKEFAEADHWGDFCPYVHTGENAGLYRHPHIALAALELFMANKCNPDKCPSTWLESPNGKDYGESMTSTSITWPEMDDNTNPIAQPALPYDWPNAGEGLFPGHELYGGLPVKPTGGSYVTKFVAMSTPETEDVSLKTGESSARIATMGVASMSIMAATIAVSLF